MAFAGYVYLILCFYIQLVVKPDIMSWHELSADIDTVKMAHSSVFIDVLLSLFILCIIITAVLCILFFGEYFLREKNIIPNFKNPSNKIYTFFIISGLILQISPLCLILLNLI